jgi:hypothetical protein
LLKDSLEAVVASIYLQLSKMILSFRYRFWCRTVFLVRFGFTDEIIQTQTVLENISTSFLPQFLGHRL